MDILERQGLTFVEGINIEAELIGRSIPQRFDKYVLKRLQVVLILNITIIRFSLLYIFLHCRSSKCRRFLQDLVEQ